MARPSKTVDIHQTLDIQLHLFAKITFNPSPILNNLTDAARFFLGQVLDQRIDVDLGLTQDLGGTWFPNPMDISQGDLSPLLIGNIHSFYPHRTSV